jgi:hypothetical protein
VPVFLGGGLAHCWVLNQRTVAWAGLWLVGVVFVGFGCPASDDTIEPVGLVGACWLGLLFGNCIVDASILRGKHVLCLFCMYSNFDRPASHDLWLCGAGFLENIFLLM